MKQETLIILEQDLKSKVSESILKQRNIEKFGYTYEIEYIPVVVERRKDGNMGEIIFPKTELIYENEND